MHLRMPGCHAVCPWRRLLDTRGFVIVKRRIRPYGFVVSGALASPASFPPVDRLTLGPRLLVFLPIYYSL